MRLPVVNPVLEVNSCTLQSPIYKWTEVSILKGIWCRFDSLMPALEQSAIWIIKVDPNKTSQG